VSKNKKNGQIIKTPTLKQKLKHHYTKRNDGVFAVNKEHSNFSLFVVNRFLMFSISRLNVEESFIEKLQIQSRERL
jgi:hypothetical protein